MIIDVIPIITSVVMVVIWAIYLQIFLTQYRRSNRPCLIIHHAQGNDPGALCLFVNMSKEPVHILGVIAHVRGKQGHVRHYVTDYRRINPDDRNVQSRLRQGPVQPGGYLMFGAFEDILLGYQSEDDPQKDCRDSGGSLQDIDALELCVAAIHGSSNHHIGARRCFSVEHEHGAVTLRAYSIHTEQLVKRGKRKIVRQWMETLLDPRYRGSEQTRDTQQMQEDDKTIRVPSIDGSS